MGRYDLSAYDADRYSTLEGYARDVCYGRLRPGTARTFFELQRRFGGSAGTLYACRERWNAAEEPDCNGTLVSPSSNPNFFSTCWSNHATGRAFDVMVGASLVPVMVTVTSWLAVPSLATVTRSRTMPSTPAASALGG